jgi:hypothetical protein
MNYGFHRLIENLFPRKWVREGECNLCGKCCETPSLVINKGIFSFAPLFYIFLVWHRYINKLQFTTLHKEENQVEFLCLHFDPVTKKCKEYAIRPVFCRTYPRIETWYSQPIFMDGCGYYAVHRDMVKLTDHLTEEEQAQIAAFQKKTEVKKNQLDPNQTDLS